MTVRFDQASLEARALQGARRGIVAATEGLRSDVLKQILRTTKSGRVYRRRGIEHQSSAPGEAPASDTGRLVGSIHTRYEDEGLTGLVVASTAYAAALEYGTPWMAPRPYMRVTLAQRRDWIEATIARFVRAAVIGK